MPSVSHNSDGLWRVKLSGKRRFRARSADVAIGMIQRTYAHFCSSQFEQAAEIQKSATQAETTIRGVFVVFLRSRRFPYSTHELVLVTFLRNKTPHISALLID